MYTIQEKILGIFIVVLMLISILIAFIPDMLLFLV